MPISSNEITTVNKDKGVSISIAGNSYQIVISEKQTGGCYDVIDMLVPPGGGPNPHSHPDIQESFYVLEEEVTFKSDQEITVQQKGVL